MISTDLFKALNILKYGHYLPMSLLITTLCWFWHCLILLDYDVKLCSARGNRKSSWCDLWDISTVLPCIWRLGLESFLINIKLSRLRNSLKMTAVLAGACKNNVILYCLLCTKHFNHVPFFSPSHIPLLPLPMYLGRDPWRKGSIWLNDFWLAPPEERYWQNRETTNIGLVTSVGRAPARQSGGCRFKSHSSKFFFVHPKFI